MSDPIGYTATLKAAGMNDRGFFPKWPCRRCGAMLQGEGDGCPAESYAGTFTGHCYSCSGAPPFPLQRFVDGAVEWSHPSCCFSYTRRRSTFTGYEGCAICKGQGRISVYQSNAMGGSYSKNCEPCHTRYLNYPPRAASWADREAWQVAARNDRIRVSKLYDKDRKKHAKKQGIADWTTVELPERVAHWRQEHTNWLAKTPEPPVFDERAEQLNPKDWH